MVFQLFPERSRTAALRTGLPQLRVQTLFERYGTGAERIADFLQAGADNPLADATYSVREIVFLIRNEAVEHLDDLLLRRTTSAISGALSLAMTDATLDILATERGWDAERRAVERHRFLTLLAARHGVSEQTLLLRNTDRSTRCETTAKSG